jgi:hypothetical protein
MRNPKGGRYTPPLRKRKTVMDEPAAGERYVELVMMSFERNAADLEEPRVAMAAIQAAEGPPPLRRPLTVEEARLYKEFREWLAARRSA